MGVKMPRGMREAITADRLDRVKERSRQKDDAARNVAEGMNKASGNKHGRDRAAMDSGRDSGGKWGGGRKR